MPSQISPRFLVPVIPACSQLLLKSVSKLSENVEWSNSLLRHFKIQTLLKINCCMAAISGFRVTQHSQIFSFFFRNRIKYIALYQLHNSQALLNLRRGYYIWRPGFTISQQNVRTRLLLSNSYYSQTVLNIHDINLKHLICLFFILSF